MSFDYDLIVIGSSLEGIYAARKAVLLQARVALVTQSKENYLNLDSWVYRRCLQEVTNSFTRFYRDPWGVGLENLAASSLSLQAIKNSANLIKENIIAENSLTELAILGVDVIYGEGEFCRLPRQALLVNKRYLRSRKFLLATGNKYTIKYDRSDYQTLPNNCFTPDTLWQQNKDNLPESLMIVGGYDCNSLELAQGLSLLGKKITFVTPHQQLLPQENMAANRLLIAHFAADNIQLFTNSLVKNIRPFDNKIKLQIKDNQLETEAIIFANNKEPNLAGLNLTGVKVKYTKQGIIVNNKLQTTNKDIYACGSLLERHNSIQTAQYEADIALKNILSFPLFKVDYSYLPKAISTQPNFTSVGLTKIVHLTEKEKRKIYIVTRHFKSIPAAQIAVATRGWCQVIIKENGEILGCTIIGDRAMELINIICLMIRQKIKLSRNPIKGLLKQEIPYVSPSFSEIFNQITIDFHMQKIQRDRGLTRRLETWFSWRK